MGLIDLFQKTRETSMEMKPQEDEAAKVVTCKGCGAELKAYAYGKNLYVCPHCGRYGRLLARTRIRQIADKDSFEELYANLAPADPIHFPGYAAKTAELAEKVGISVVYLSKIENGRVYPTLETLSNICTELGIDIAEILTNTEIARKEYANDRVLELFNSCSMRVKPIALSVLEDLSKL